MQNPAQRKKLCLSASFCAALFTAFSVVVFGAIDTYVTNNYSIDFTLAQLWPGLAVLFVGCVALGFGALWLAQKLNPTLGEVLTLLLVGVGLAFYVQGNYLCVNADQLVDKAGSEPLAFWPTFLNCAIWLVITLAPLAIYLVCRRARPQTSNGALRLSRVVCLMLTVAQIASLVVILGPVLPEKQVVYKFSTKDDFTLSDSDNTIVLILDSVSDQHLSQVLAETPEYAKEFTGFTHYANVVGSYSNTAGSFSYFITGQRYQNECTYGEYVTTALARDTFWADLKKMGYGVYIGESGNAGIELDAAQKGWFDNLDAYSIVVSSTPTLISRMMHLTMYRFSPDIVKPFLYSRTLLEHIHAVIDWDSSEGYPAFQKANQFFRDELKQKGLSTASGKSFHLYFLYGAHQNMSIDENGEDASTYIDDYPRALRGCMTIVGEFLKQLKQAGLYDSANILVMSDHPDRVSGHQEIIKNPILLIKPKNATGAMTDSAAPVSFDDVRPTLMELMGGDGARYGRSVFDIQEGEQRERLFYAYDFERMNNSRVYFTPITEYRFSSDGKTCEPTGNVYSH